MLVGLAIFVIGRRHLPPDVRPAMVARESHATRLGPDDWRAIGTLCLITLLVTFFWAGYEQTGNAVVLWVRDFTDRSFFGWLDLRVTWFQSIGPLLIFTLTPAVLWLWRTQAARGREPDMITKLATGCFLAAAAYAVLVLAAMQAGATGHAAWEWTVLFFVLLTLGELHVSPVALSLYSRLAPARVASQMMGLWFMSGVLGNYLAGVLGSFWERLGPGTFWMCVGSVPLLAGLLLMASRGLVSRSTGRSRSAPAHHAHP
jgi:POT family proton-dependent oligopeptide transporter